MSVTFTKEAIDLKISEFKEGIASLNQQIECWNKIRELIPEEEPAQ